MVPFAFANSIYCKSSLRRKKFNKIKALAQDNDDVPQEENLTDQFWRTIFADTFPQVKLTKSDLTSLKVAERSEANSA